MGAVRGAEVVETALRSFRPGTGGDGDGDEKSAPGDGGGGIEFKSRVFREVAGPARRSRARPSRQSARLTANPRVPALRLRPSAARLARSNVNAPRSTGPPGASARPSISSPGAARAGWVARGAARTNAACSATASSGGLARRAVPCRGRTTCSRTDRSRRRRRRCRTATAGRCPGRCRRGLGPRRGGARSGRRRRGGGGGACRFRTWARRRRRRRIRSRGWRAWRIPTRSRRRRSGSSVCSDFGGVAVGHLLVLVHRRLLVHRARRWAN